MSYFWKDVVDALRDPFVKWCVFLMVVFLAFTTVLLSVLSAYP